MKKLLALCSVVLILAVAACGGGGGGGGSSDDGSKCGGGGCNPMADIMLKSYTDGQAKAMYAVALHADAKAGQYWITKMVSDYGGAKSEMTDKWQVAAVSPDGVVVEQFMGSYGIVLAYLVDPAVSKEDMWKKGNVKKAWAGKPGEAPAEIQIMEVPKPTEGGPAPEKNYTDGVEDFKDVELGGGKWSGKKSWMKMNDGSMESSTWTADNGWFNGVIKMESKMAAGSSTMTLEKFGEGFEKDGKAWLKW
ncbi:hypothetical protein GPROT1_00234 [Gammaproteobacteria bacterium]|nr:hypothetical protein GPROT1_00234 [Gammaproteobacteria bacterium]